MGRIFKQLAAAVGFAALAACGGQDGRNGSNSDGAFSFVVIGDTPYDDEDAAMLAEAIPLVHASRTPFVIHLGDYKGGSAPCTDDHDEAFAKLIDDLKPIPVFLPPATTSGQTATVISTKKPVANTPTSTGWRKSAPCFSPNCLIRRRICNIADRRKA